MHGNIYAGNAAIIRMAFSTRKKAGTNPALSTEQFNAGY
jgi:hypothetical protein